MTTHLPKSLRALLFTAIVVGSVGVAHAQFEISGVGFSRLFLGSVPDGVTPATLTPQFAGEYGNAGGSGIKNAANITDLIPATVILRYPSTVTYVLPRSTFGGSFSPGVPRFVLGDNIPAPGTQIDGVATADALYWRQQPVGIGESFVQTVTATTDTPIALTIASIKVTNGGSGYTSVPTVTISGGGGGTGATATATLTQGVVTALTLTAAGSGAWAVSHSVMSHQ